MCVLGVNVKMTESIGRGIISALTFGSISSLIFGVDGFCTLMIAYHPCVESTFIIASTNESLADQTTPVDKVVSMQD